MMSDDGRPKFAARIRTHDPAVCGPVPYIYTMMAGYLHIISRYLYLSIGFQHEPMYTYQPSK